MSVETGKDRPILFSAPMVRALLEGRKSQTRRKLDPQPRAFDHPDDGHRCWAASGGVGGRICISDRDLLGLHRWRPGDRLWVREAHYLTDDGHEDFAVYAAEESDVREHLAEVASLPASFPADVRARHLRRRPGIHMPRWASRLTLTVTDVRVEGLQDISEADALAEGARPAPGGWWTMAEGQSATSVVGAFALLWQSINGPGSWAANPWVVAVSFETIQANIDAVAQPSGDGAAHLACSDARLACVLVTE